MEVDVDHDGIADCFTLDRDELARLRNKSAETRLGFALQLKFLLWRGSFPQDASEIPGDAVGYVARQVEVDPSGIALYDFVGRAAQRHRKEIREVCGFRPCTVDDAEHLTAWLINNSAKMERREEQVRADLLARCRTERIEPPAAERIGRIVRSALRQAEDALMMQTVTRLDAVPGTDAHLEALVEDGGSVDEADTDDHRLAEIKADPGTVGLKSMKAETRKLAAVRAIGLPHGLFLDVAPKVLATWRARAMVESPSHLRAHDRPVRLTLLAALAYVRQREIIDTLVELFNSVVHDVNARAEKRVTEELVNAFKRVTGKENILCSIAEAS